MIRPVFLLTFGGTVAESVANAAKLELVDSWDDPGSDVLLDSAGVALFVIVVSIDVKRMRASRQNLLSQSVRMFGLDFAAS